MGLDPLSVTDHFTTLFLHPPGADDTIALFEVLHRQFLPDYVVAYRNIDDDKDAEGFSPRVRDCKLMNGKAAAYVWDGPNTRFVGTDPQALKTAVIEDRRDGALA